MLSCWLLLSSSQWQWHQQWVRCIVCTYRQTFSSLWAQLPFDPNHNTELHWTRWSENESPSVMSDFLRYHGLYSPWNSLGRNSGVGSLSLLQGNFLIQGSSPGLSHCRHILYQLSHKGSPRILEWVAYSFSSGSSRHRNRTEVSSIAGGFFTKWATREALILGDKMIKKITYIQCLVKGKN